MRTHVAAGAVGLAALLIGCDKGPTQPRVDSTSSSAITRLDINGPRSVAPNGTAQFAVVAHQTDGSSRDVTAQATWNSSNSGVLAIAAGGVASGLQVGEATLRAFFQGHGSSREVIVVPSGTFRLTGRVTEAGTADERVRGAAVEATGPGGVPVATTTGGDGLYRLYGVVGDGELRVTREGYEPYVQGLGLTDHGTLNVELRLSRARPDVAGAYTLTIRAAGECGGILPDEAMTRRYAAVLTQSGSRVTVTLADAAFLVVAGTPRNRFNGTIEGNRIRFTLEGPFNYYYYYHPQIVEELTTSTFFVPYGVAETGSLPANRISAPLDGRVEIREPAGSSRLSVVATCHSAAHELVLAR